MVSGFIFAQKLPETGCEGQIRAFYEQPRIVYYPKPVVYASLVNTDYEIVIDRIINCLIRIESGGNPEAYNPSDIDGRPKYGILQYDSRTFTGYCVERYGYVNDIWNPEIQRSCAFSMIKEDFQNVYHWPTFKHCH